MPSRTWSIPQTLSLWARAGVIMVTLTYDSYGMPWRKVTGVLTHLTYGHNLNIPDTSFNPSVMLRGLIWYNGEECFRTKLAQSYPTLFAERYAKVAQCSMDSRKLELELGEKGDDGRPGLRRESMDARGGVPSST